MMKHKGKEDNMKVVLGIKLYDSVELANILSLTVEAARQYLREKTIAGCKIGTKWYVTEENLKRFVNAENVN